MGYYIDVLCMEIELPPLRAILDEVIAQGYPVTVDPESPVDLDSQDWGTDGLIAIQYMDLPLCAVEIVKKTASVDDTFHQRIAEYYEMIEDETADSPGKSKVLNHLRQTKFFVQTQVLFATRSSELGFETLGAFLGYFVDHCGGMVHADTEGFYDEDGELILEVG